MCTCCVAESSSLASDGIKEVDRGTVSDPPPVPSSSVSPIAEFSSTAENLVEWADAVPCSSQCLFKSLSSSALDVDSCGGNGANCTSSTISVPRDIIEVCPVKLLRSTESASALCQWSEDVLEPFDAGQKWSDVSFRNRRNSSSSSSLSELFDNRSSRSCLAVSLSRKRRHDDDALECGRLTFDKLPNYYTALSIPARVTAGSVARSSSDLIAGFLHGEREPSPERKSCSVYDKLPAYYSSFTNSTRYDDQDHSSLSTFDAGFCKDETEDDSRFGRSGGDEQYVFRGLSSADELVTEGSDAENEKETSSENVSNFCVIGVLN